MKNEITASEYWDLPESIQKKYQRVAFVFDGRYWVERTFYSEKPLEIKVVYQLKPSTFGGMGMGTF